MLKPVLTLAAMAAVLASSPAFAAGDPALGKKAYIQCMACHGAQGQGSALGPPLKGIVGKKAGQAPGFVYSPAMKASGLTWTEANLAEFVAAPQTKLKGTRMIYAGMKKPADVENLIAHLKTLK